MITILDLVEQDTHVRRASFRELAGPCPNPECSCRHDGFHIDPQRNPVRKRNERGEWVDDQTQPPRGGFRCRGCWHSEELLPDGSRKRGWGTPFDYLVHVRKMSSKQASDYLKQHTDTPSSSVTPRAERYERWENYRSEHWQQDAETTMQEYIERLWDPSDTLALDYLHGRGFEDEIIRKARLGYSKHGGVPRLIIPSINQRRYVAIYRRDLRPDVSHEQRWKDAPGGTKSELYLAECLASQRPTILTEAPLDALSVVQACQGLVNVVATGGTSCARQDRWILQLMQMPRLAVAFDADAAGDEAARWWLERLPRARRLRPLAHDLNAMLTGGHDLRTWILDHFEACCVCACPISASEQNPDLEFRYDEHGTLYCMQHYPTEAHNANKSEIAPLEPAQPADETIEDDPSTAGCDGSASPAQSPSMAGCDPLSRGHGGSASPAQASSMVGCSPAQERFQQFMDSVKRIADEYPQLCKITIHPPGYTIEERARELRAEKQAQEQADAERIWQIRERRMQTLSKRLWQREMV